MISFLKNSWIYIAGAFLFGFVLLSAYLKGRRDKALEDAIKAFKELNKNVKKREKVEKHYESINKTSSQANAEMERVTKLARSRGM